MSFFRTKNERQIYMKGALSSDLDKKFTITQINIVQKQDLKRHLLRAIF